MQLNLRDEHCTIAPLCADILVIRCLCKGRVLEARKDCGPCLFLSALHSRRAVVCFPVLSQERVGVLSTNWATNYAVCAVVVFIKVNEVVEIPIKGSGSSGTASGSLSCVSFNCSEARSLSEFLKESLMDC